MQSSITDSAEPAFSSIPPITKTTRTRILQAFTGKISRVWVSPLYQLGLLLVGLAMILLPLAYLLLIVGLGFLVYLHATNDYGMIYASHNARAQMMLGLAYLSPIVAGCISIFFMLKPFLAKRGVHLTSVTVKREDEPLLFEFVDKLCETIRAPKPHRIEVDCDVNASAGLSGGVFGLLIPRLVLTIGLPLIKGMSTTELAGILAHEFGHFSQGIAMRLSFVVRRINAWFGAVVYERDEWDERLLDWSDEKNGRFSYMFLLARLMVWLGRRVLWVLMKIGNIISCFLMRQMEYNADRYEVRLAGSDTFRDSTKRIALLSMAWGVVRRDLMLAYREGRLGDDTASLVAQRALEAPPEVHTTIEELMTKGGTEWFATHPSDSSRVAKAMKQKEVGVFYFDEPATVLFRDYSAIARSATLMFYHAALGAKFNQAELVTTEELTHRRAEVENKQDAQRRYFQEAFPVACPFTLGPSRIPVPTDFNAVAQQVVAARKQMLSGLAAARAARRVIESVMPQIDNTELALSLLRVGVRLPADAWSFDSSTKETIQRAQTEAIRGKERAEEALEEFAGVSRTRLISSLQLLHNSRLKRKMQERYTEPQEAQRLLDLMALLRYGLESVALLDRDFRSVSAVFSLIRANPKITNLAHKAHEYLKSCGNRMKTIETIFREEPYPFEHTTPGMTISRYLAGGMLSLDASQTFEKAREILENFDTLYGRVLSTLCHIAENVETTLGLTPLAGPNEALADESAAAEAS